MAPPAPAPTAVSDPTSRRPSGATASPASDQEAQPQPACACGDTGDPPATDEVVGTLLAFVLAGSALLVAIVLLNMSLA